MPSWRRHGKRRPDSLKPLANHSVPKSLSATQSFFLAATLHPEVVRLAQQELDEVLGGERLPDFSDKPRLPYISAIVKEVLRWRPPTPLGASSCNVLSCLDWTGPASGISRRLREDDVYKGQFIPAGTTIVDNTWYVTRFCGFLLATD
jgi:cytochrome P450